MKDQSKNQYIVTIGIVALPVFGLISVVLISIFLPSKDNGQIITALFQFVTLCVGTLLTFRAAIKANETAQKAVESSKDNSAKLDNVHKELNSRLSELVESKRAEGVSAGRDEVRAENKIELAAANQVVVDVLRSTGPLKPLEG